MKLTIKQRISVAAGIYILLILGIGYFVKGDLHFITNTPLDVEVVIESYIEN